LSSGGTGGSPAFAPILLPHDLELNVGIGIGVLL
jgi:hypothetical protein